MPLSAQDIAIAAIVVMALAGLVILFSAWRYTVRTERAAEKSDRSHLSPAT